MKKGDLQLLFMASMSFLRCKKSGEKGGRGGGKNEGQGKTGIMERSPGESLMREVLLLHADCRQKGKAGLQTQSKKGYYGRGHEKLGKKRS